jgi:hypothetical protein
MIKWSIWSEETDLHICVCAWCSCLWKVRYTLYKLAQFPHTLRNSSQTDVSQTRAPKHTHKQVSLVHPIKCSTSHMLNILNLVEFILTELLYYKWYTQTATYHVNIERMQISGRHYINGTKHGILTLKMVE